MLDMDRYLKSTEIIDFDTPSVRKKAEEVTKGLPNDREKAVALYYFVRDGIRHNAYAELYDISRYKASSVLEAGNGICQQKSVLLTALARAAGIPARLGYVDVNDFQLSETFKKMIGGVNVFPFHGFAELYVEGKWVHASPAYDINTCRRKRFVPVEFDGVNDAVDSRYNQDGEPHIEHLRYHGPYEDFPWEEIMSYYKEWASKLGLGWEELKGAGEQVREQKSFGNEP
ncbi:MAG: transglutaminase domain-containing protein [Dehalococcoidia bacterium]|nr:transglutaminase domain-containing protein [Dehalococcoidia bacterium]